MIRPKSFWTPRYVFDRLRLAYDQKRNPVRPWWPREAARVIDQLLTPEDRVLEWGSGRSTAWLVERVKSIHSVEHDREWFDRVKGQIAAFGPERAQIELLTDASSTPMSESEEARRSEYVRVIEKFDDGEFTVAVVDGVDRGYCALAAVDRIASSGFIICDDASWFIDVPTRVPHARTGQGHLGEWAEFVEKTKSWRRIWTTDGVTDTAIFLKP
jgi:hypothetical protein